MMIMHQTDKEHEELEEACTTSEVQHCQKSSMWSLDWSELMLCWLCMQWSIAGSEVDYSITRPWRAH